MKEYEVKMVFDLKNPEEANLYNSIRSLDGIKNAILNFKGYIQQAFKESEEIKVTTPEGMKSAFLVKIKDILNNFERSFKDNGITV